MYLHCSLSNFEYLLFFSSCYNLCCQSLSDMCAGTNAFTKSIATLGNVEENDTVSRALSRLSEVEERVEALHQEQVGCLLSSCVCT